MLVQQLQMKQLHLLNCLNSRFRTCHTHAGVSVRCRTQQVASASAVPTATLTADQANCILDQLKTSDDVCVRASLARTSRGLGLMHQVPAPPPEASDSDAEGPSGIGVVDPSVAMFLPAKLCISAEHGACWPFARCDHGVRI